MKNLSAIFKVQNIFLIMCLFWGAFFIVLNPPFQAPDEDAHLFKMYAYTTGSLNFKKENGYAGQILPESFVNMQKYYDVIKLNNKAKTSLKELEIVSSIELEKDKNVFFKFIPTWYTPLSYLPSFLVLWVLKFLNVKPLFMIYILRFCSLFTYLALMYGAIYLTPVKKWLFFTIAVLPLCIYQAGAISTDALTFGLGFLLFAYTLRLKSTVVSDENVSNQNTIGKKQLCIWGFLFIYLCFCKYAYFPLGLLYLLLPKSKFESDKVYWLGFWIINSINVLLILMFLGINFWVSDGVITELTKKTVSKTVLIKGILKNPFDYLYHVLASTKYLFRFYLNNMISSFGWTMVMIPKFLSNIYYILIFAAVFFEAHAKEKSQEIFNLKDKLILFVSVAFSYLIIITSVYLLYQKYPLISGVQGRYLTILLPLTALIFTPKRFLTKSKTVPVMLVIMSNILMFAALLTMINRFY